MQFFARQGYVVLAPNFRGGSGYGRAFADLRQWDRAAADFIRAIDLQAGDPLLWYHHAVTATGLKMVPLGGMRLRVDGRAVELEETVAYRGMQISGVPNMAVAIGYTNASWTLQCDLTHAYVCRLLNHMDERGYRQCTPENRDPSIEPQPLETRTQ